MTNYDDYTTLFRAAAGSEEVRKVSIATMIVTALHLRLSILNKTTRS